MLEYNLGMAEQTRTAAEQGTGRKFDLRGASQPGHTFEGLEQRPEGGEMQGAGRWPGVSSSFLSWTPSSDHSMAVTWAYRPPVVLETTHKY